jgi:hypothetical protein
MKKEMKIMLGVTEISPSGIFNDHVSHNVGKNHETYIEYPDMREISLPLSANGNIINLQTKGKTPFQAIFGNWNGKGIYERGACREAQRRERQEKISLLTQKEMEILKNREYYYGNRR